VRRIIFVVLNKFQIFDINDWYRDIVDREPRRHRKSGREVIDGRKIVSVDQGQYISVRYTINLVLLAAVCSSREIHLTNYSVVLKNATVREV
jgi:hypothetical protein